MKKTLYLFSHGRLMRKDNTIAFEAHDAERKKFLPIEDIKEIYLFGEVDMNSKVLDFLSQKEVILHFFNHYGYYTGSFYPREHHNAGYMIVKQVEHYQDAEKRLELARSFVQGSTHNLLQVLKYYNNRGKDVATQIAEMEQLATRLPTMPDVPSLMAIEGNIRERYYPAFDCILEQADFVFEGRSRRPPLNYLNTMISFGNSVMYTMVLSEIYKTHLDSRIGYLHTTNFRRHSLNLDVAEIFKPVIVDRVILSLIGKKMINKKHFAKETGGVLLNEEGKKIFLRELDEKMKTTVKHRKLQRPVSNRVLMRLELYKLQKHFMGDQRYEPYLAKW